MQKNKKLTSLIWLIIFFVGLFSLVNSFQLTLNNSSTMQYTYYLSLYDHHSESLDLVPNSDLVVTELKVKTITGSQLLKLNLKQKTDYQNVTGYNNYLNILHISKEGNHKSDWKIIYIIAISLSGLIFMGVMLFRTMILLIYNTVNSLNIRFIRLCLIGLFCGVYILGALSNSAVYKFQNDSDSLTYMSFYLNKSSIGQMKVYQESTQLYVENLVDKGIPPQAISQECDLTKINSNICYLPYNSSFGLQAHIFTFLGKIFGLNSISSFILFCQIIESLILAVVVAELILLFYRLFGKMVFMSVFLGLFSTYILAKFAPSVYWNVWIMLLPFLVSSKYMLDKTSRLFHNNRLLYGSLFIVFLVKMLFGYEYLSSIVLSAMLPLLWDGKYLRFRDKFKPIFMIGIISIFAFAISLVLWWWKLGSNEFYNAVISDVVRRISFLQNLDLHPVINVLDVKDQTYQDSLHASFLTVFMRVFFKQDFFLFLGFYILIAGLIGTYYLAFIKQVVTEQLSSLFKLTLLSLIAPLSWYIIAKPHTYVHAHLNALLWLLPTGFYIYVFMGIAIHLLLNRKVNG